MSPIRTLPSGFSKFPGSLFLPLTTPIPTELISVSTINRKIILISQLIIHQIHSSSYLFLSTSQLASNSLLSSKTSHWDVAILHAHATKIGSVQQIHVGNHLLNLYVKCRDLVQAWKLFDEIPIRDVRTWTVLITAYAQAGQFMVALDSFYRMQSEGIFPNQFTFSSVLKCCACLNNLWMGKGIHGWILRNGIGFDVILENSVMDLYVKCGAFDYARRMFEFMDERNSVSWNIMIGGYLQIGDGDKSMDFFRRLHYKDVATWNTVIVGQLRNGFERTALDLLYQMREDGPEFNEVTFSTALALVTSLSALELGRQIHGQVVRIGHDSNEFIRNSLIDMYCKSGEMQKALMIFEKLPQDSCSMRKSKAFHDRSVRSVITTVSSSSIVAGYVQNGKCEEALQLFCKIAHEGTEVDVYTLTSIFSACANSGILEQGRQIHAHAEKHGHRSDAILGSAMIDMYTKCGSLDDARLIFSQIDSQNVVLWTSIICGCALHGQGKEAISLFELMLNEGIIPNDISFVGLLSACSHSGLVEEGFVYFRLMQEDYSIMPGVEHFTCMVDLLGRAGRLDEAMDFIHKHCISHLSAVLRPLLSACRLHKNIEMGKLISRKLLEVEPLDPGSYILLSNICATSHHWEEAAGLRILMQEKGVRKTPGQSWIQLKNRVHSFIVGDRSHPQADQIFSFLESLILRLKEAGYSVDTNLVLHDVEEEQKEVLIGLHSEKIAIAYGIMNTPCGQPIRIMKNLRVCTDCHTFMKYTSQVLSRVIVVRDIHRFHHFKHGKCSCGDYW